MAAVSMRARNFQKVFLPFLLPTKMGVGLE